MNRSSGIAACLDMVFKTAALAKELAPESWKGPKAPCIACLWRCFNSPVQYRKIAANGQLKTRLRRAARAQVRQAA